VLHAEVVRGLVGDSRDEKGAKELAGHVFSDAHAGGTAEIRHARAVGGVAIRRDRNASFSGDSDETERGKEVAGG
jgi:hypothetical protein